MHTLQLLSFFAKNVNRKTPLVLTVAIIGLVANLAGIWVLRKTSRENLNVQGAFLHILGDTLSSVGVIMGEIIIFFTGWYIIDPLIGVLIGGIILRGAVGLVMESGNILLEGVPRHINIEKVASAVKITPGVRDIHDLHIWAITSGIYALSGHLRIDDQMVSKSSDILAEVNHLLSERFGIGHTTLQLECESCVNGLVCRLENPER
ncbi:cation diffusion facilitator family transporter [Candidatus Hakubella thermalkaliphila]|uniref:cation diffusion facilitator family transporter n=1 Tax=Candidatus Hakubella thermalkaliphila TaxID=2754717 RepID=UPI00280C1171|nr:cation diffusion facilitator family transporter [Candidatus Hakubella thermalkaliphila]